MTGVEREPDFAEARAGDILRSVIDPGLAERELEWRPAHDVESGLRATWEWMQAH